jgi:drug/metabolite transporter (DMT)-like permease
LAHDANDRWRRHVLQEPETLITKDTVQLEEETILKDPNALVIGIDAAPVLYTTLSSHKPVSRELRVVVPKLSTVVLGEKIDTNDEYRRGLLIIGFITLLFSSNSPALHVAFTETGAPPVLLLNAAVSVVALVGLVFGGPILEATTPLPSALLRNQDKGSSNHNSVLSKDQIAGLELGLWKFLGTTANLFGLSLTTASHGAFLIQLTTLIVPVVQGMMGVPIPRRVQFSVALALAGVAMFTQDVGSVDLSSMPNVALGDALCVVAAGFYATYDLRLFQYGKQIKARSLITNKIATQAILSILLLLIAGREETMQFLSSTSIFSDSNTILALVILWSGIAVNAVAPFLQVGGQQAVGATRAQTIYASQPLWAAMLSCILLGETVGLQGMIGGSAFLAALFLAATAEAPEPDCGKENCEV